MSADRGLFVSLTAVLAGVGVLMVYSASITSWPTDFERVYLSRHLIFLVIGVCAAAFAANMPAEWWRRMTPYLFLATIVLLVVVLVPGLGTAVKGARRWLRFGPVSLQPSEVAKLTLPLMLAALLSKRTPEELRRPIRGTVLILLPVALVLPLVLIEPDLGTMVFLAGGATVALWAGGWPIRNFIIGAGLAVPASVFAIALKPYQIKRITGFLAGWSDFSEAPYQLRQSLFALGAGGTDGAGVGKGWQKLSFLPEANTDFVFSVLGEELGLVGTLAVVGLWCGFLYVGLRLLRTVPPRSFAGIAAFTLIVQLVMQAALNAAVVTGLVPPKGIPHPFLSSGGSNLVMSLLSVGVVLSLTKSNDQIASPNDQ